LWFFAAVLFAIFTVGIFLGWGTDDVLSPFFLYMVISWGYGYIRKSKRFRKDPTAVDAPKELTDKELNMMGYAAVSYYFLLPIFLLLFIFLR
jgi:hypothetical protein